MATAKLHNNGRDKRTKGALSQITIEMQESEAFQSLTASGMSVLLYAIFLNFWAGTHDTGKPVFKFTNQTAREKLGMNQAKFTRAKQDLANKGFWKWTLHGGLKGCNGVASEFTLSSDWKRWVSPQKKKPFNPFIEKESSHASVTGSSHASVTGTDNLNVIKPQSSHANMTGSAEKQSRHCVTINTITRVHDENDNRKELICQQSRE
jgi:hypothetical protein